MPYNPNAIWGSKSQKIDYLDANSPAKPPTGGGQPQQGGGDTPPSFFHRHRLMFFSIGLVVALGLAGLVVYLLMPPPTPNIEFSFSNSNSGPIVVGTPFTLTVTVSNQSSNVLKNADLAIILPKGLSFVGKDPSQAVLETMIDTLSSKTINPPQNVTIIATGNQGTTKTIGVKLTYETTQTASTQFENDGQTDVTIGGQPALEFTPSSTTGIYSGQNFTLEWDYANNSQQTLQGIKIKMDYPPAYTFATSSLPVADIAGDTWNIGTLAPNATGSLIVVGNISGPEKAPYQLPATISANFSGQDYPVNSGLENLTIAASPLIASINVNGSSSYVSRAGDNLNYTITYTNNSNITFQTVNVSAVLSGQMFDFSSLATDGSFNSKTNTITWYTANTPELMSLAPGQSGSVNFTVNVKPALAVKGANYLLKVAAQVQSPTVPQNTVGANTVALASLATKVGGQIAIGSDGYWKDPTSGIANTGPYPPKINQATTYTIHWDITNYSTDAKNVTVSAYLQSGTNYTGKVKSNISSSTPTFNADTGQITWTIPGVAAGTGVTNAPLEAVFQVTNTPAVNEIGQDVTLIGPTTITATDAFTGAAMTATADPVTTAIPKDATGGSNDRTVNQ